VWEKAIGAINEVLYDIPGYSSSSTQNAVTNLLKGTIKIIKPSPTSPNSTKFSSSNGWHRFRR
jgi:hypothetical protein